MLAKQKKLRRKNEKIIAAVSRTYSRTNTFHAILDSVNKINTF